MIGGWALVFGGFATSALYAFALDAYVAMAVFVIGLVVAFGALYCDRGPDFEPERRS